MWPFKSGKTERKAQLLQFKDGKGFFEYQCQFGQVDIVPKQGLIGWVTIVSDDAQSGIQNATLQIVSRDGGFEVFSQTASGKGDRLSVGDIVIWVALQRDNVIAPQYRPDPRSHWVGLIVARVASEIDLRSENFRLLCRYA